MTPTPPLVPLSNADVPSTFFYSTPPHQIGHPPGTTVRHLPSYTADISLVPPSTEDMPIFASTAVIPPFPSFSFENETTEVIPMIDMANVLNITFVTEHYIEYYELEYAELVALGDALDDDSSCRHGTSSYAGISQVPKAVSYIDDDGFLDDEDNFSQGFGDVALGSGSIDETTDSSDDDSNKDDSDNGGVSGHYHWSKDPEYIAFVNGTWHPDMF